MVKEFIRLLEEKQELDETDDESEGEGPATQPAGGAADAEGSDDEDSDDDEGEGEEEEGEAGEGDGIEEESSEEESSEEEDEAVLKALEALRLGAPKRSRLGHAAAGASAAPPAPAAAAALTPAQEREARAQLLVQRSALRAALRASIVELRHAQHAAKLAGGDPLLAA